MRKIFVVGDSISIHYGPYLERGLRGVMAYDRKGGQAEASRNPDPPADANGGDSAMVLAYLRRLKDGGGPDADTLLLNCGLHDIKRDPVSGACQVPIDAYARTWRRSWTWPGRWDSMWSGCAPHPATSGFTTAPA